MAGKLDATDGLVPVDTFGRGGGKYAGAFDKKPKQDGAGSAPALKPSVHKKDRLDPDDDLIAVDPLRPDGSTGTGIGDQLMKRRRG